MSDPTFTTPPDAPSRASPTTFAARADAFVSWIVTFVSELTTAVTWFAARTDEVSTDTASALASRNAAETAADEAEQSAVSAAAVANFQGAYSGATAYATGQSVYYNGDYWIALAGNTGQTPAINSDFWALAPGQPAERFLDTLPPATVDLQFGRSTRIAQEGGITEATLSSFATFSRGGDVANYVDATGQERTSGVDEPAVAYDSKTRLLQGLLFQPTRTNDLSDPTDPSQASWSKSDLETPVKDQPGLHGEANGGWSIVESNDTAQLHALSKNAIAIDAGESRIYWAKVAPFDSGGRSVRLRIDGHPDASGDTFTRVFDLDAKTAGTAATGGDVTSSDSGIRELRNGYLLIYAAVKFGAAVTTSRMFLDLINDQGLSTYDGDGVSGFVFHSANSTEGEFVTSLIASDGETRLFDRLTIDGTDATDALNVEEGTLFCDLHLLGFSKTVTGGTAGIQLISDDSDNRIDLRLVCNNDGTVDADFRSRIAATFNDTGAQELADTSYGARHKLALTYGKGGNLKASLNGQTVTITTGIPWSQDVNEIYIQAPSDFAIAYRDVIYRPKALTQTEINLRTRN